MQKIEKYFYRQSALPHKFTIHPIQRNDATSSKESAMIKNHNNKTLAITCHNRRCHLPFARQNSQGRMGRTHHTATAAPKTGPEVEQYSQQFDPLCKQHGSKDNTTPTGCLIKKAGLSAVIFFQVFHCIISNTVVPLQVKHNDLPLPDARPCTYMHGVLCLPANTRYCAPMRQDRGGRQGDHSPYLLPYLVSPPLQKPPQEYRKTKTP